MARPAAEFFVSGKGNDVFKLHGSVYGGCLHSQVLALMGAEPAPAFPAVQRVYEWGHGREAVMKEDLVAAGFPLFHASDQVREQLELSLFEKYDDTGKTWLLLSLHPDGIVQLPEGVDPSSLLAAAHFNIVVGLHLWKPGTLALLECKTSKGGKDGDFDAYVKSGLSINERYEYQVAGSLHAARNNREVKDLRRGPVEGTLFLVEERVVVPVEQNGKKVNESRPGQRLAIYLPEAPRSYEECMGRCREVVDLYKAGIVPECDSKFPCSYKTSGPKVIEDLDDNDALHQLADEFVKARSDAAFYADLQNSARAALIEQFGGKARCFRAVQKLGDGTELRHVVDYRINKKGVGTLTVEREQ